MQVQRHFVTVRGRFGERQVHYRRAGRGPLVVLLHQSPQSSRELEPLMAEWAGDFTVVAPDSPGYGQSDPLGLAEATLDDFAGATIEFLDAIGAGRAGVYGFHTGGMIGIALGHRHPERITAVACNGVAVLTPGERERILRDYLVPLVPGWDGGHLAWLWARMREQAIFFPWHHASKATRMSFPMAPPDRLQAALLEFLRASKHYHVAYRAAFVYPGPEVLKETTAPTLVTSPARDPIAPHLKRVPDPSKAVQLRPAADTAEALAFCHEHLAARPGDVPPAPPSATALPSRLWSDVVPNSWGQVHVRVGGAAGAVPVIVLHGPAGSGALHLDLAQELAATHPVVIPDLPGHGESSPPPALPRLTDLDAWFVELCGTLGLRRAHLVATGAAAALAVYVALSPRSALLVDRLALLDADFPNGEEAAIARAGVNRDGVDWYGGHLLRAWHTVRDARLYYPWNRREPAGVRTDEPRVDPEDVQREVTELLKAGDCWQSLVEDQLDYPLAARLASDALTGRVLIGIVPGSPRQSAGEDAARRTGLPSAVLDAGRSGWGTAAAAFLAGGDG